MNETESMKAVNEKVAAKMLGFSVKTLQNRRYLAQPPRFVRIGRSIRYRVADLEAFLNECTVEPRTEQYA